MSQTGTGATAPAPWTPPTSDQEWEVTTIAEAPDWIDKSWAGFDRGPAIAVPAGDLFGDGPYHTMSARTGDKLLFIAATPSKAAHFEVVRKEPEPGSAGFTAKPVQATNASLEDMLKTGFMSPDELGDDAKAEVAARSPRLAKMIEDGTGAPEPIAVTDVVKTS